MKHTFVRMFRDSWTRYTVLLRCLWETGFVFLWFGPTVHGLCCSSVSQTDFSSNSGRILCCVRNMCVSSHYLSPSNFNFFLSLSLSLSLSPISAYLSLQESCEQLMPVGDWKVWTYEHTAAMLRISLLHLLCSSCLSSILRKNRMVESFIIWKKGHWFWAAIQFFVWILNARWLVTGNANMPIWVIVSLNVFLWFTWLFQGVPACQFYESFMFCSARQTSQMNTTLIIFEA